MDIKATTINIFVKIVEMLGTIESLCKDWQNTANFDLRVTPDHGALERRDCSARPKHSNVDDKKLGSDYHLRLHRPRVQRADFLNVLLSRPRSDASVP